MATRTVSKSRRQYQSGGAVPMRYVRPQLCKLVETAPTGERWVHETKFDGYRMQMHLRSGKAVFYSRNGLDWTHRFPEIVDACSTLSNAVIDGEVCGTDKEGLPSFSKLTDALSSKSTASLVYYVFDVLYGNDEDLTSYPLTTRKNVLKKLLKEIPKKHRNRVRYVDHHEGNGPALHQAACEMHLEGIVSKVKDAPYKPDDRSGIWTKAKCRPAQEFVVGGWKTDGARFRSLLLGAYRGGRFEYVGHAGTGFNQNNLPDLKKKLASLKTEERPFENSGEPKKARETRWAKPELVVEVEFATWTSDGLLRQVSFKGMREDKDPKKVVVERA
jgi:bifunctional non-homologous end joining protein LigD